MRSGEYPSGAMVKGKVIFCITLPGTHEIHWRPSILEAGIAHRNALCQKRRLILSGFELTTPLEVSRKPCHGLAMIFPSRTVSFLPQSDHPFLRKEQTYEITIHVPLTRVRGAPPLLTQTD